MNIRRLAIAATFVLAVPAVGTVGSNAAPDPARSSGTARRPEAPARQFAARVAFTNSTAALRHSILSGLRPDPSLQAVAPFGVAISDRSETSPRVAFDPKRNRYLVVWAVETREGAQEPRDIYGAFVQVNGVGMREEEYLPIATSADDESQPSVAYNSAIDEYVVVWIHDWGYFDTDPRWQRLNAQTGSPIGGVLDVDRRSDHAMTPVVAANNLPGADARWYFAYQSDPDLFVNTPIDTLLLGGRASQTGMIDTTYRVSADSFDVEGAYEVHSVQPQLTFAPAGNRFLLSWFDSDGVDFDVLARSIDANTGALGPVSTVSNCGRCDDVEGQTIAFNPATSTALVAWNDFRNYTHNAGPYTVHGRIVGVDAVPVTSEFQIEASRCSPSLSPDPTGGWTVAFGQMNLTAGSPDTDIGGRWVGPAGTLGPFFAVTNDSGTSPVNDDSPRMMVPNPYFGTHLLTFEHNYSATDTEVYGSFIAPVTSPLVIAKGDFDGDRRTDRTVVRLNQSGPAAGALTWYIVKSSGGAAATTWGAVGDVPVPGDYDGDGKTDVAVWRPSEGGWYFVGSSGASWAYAFGSGAAGDRPVPADYDGDGKTDMAVFRTGSTSAFYIIRSSTRAAYAVSWGTWGDVPVPGDFDGDGKTDIAVWRPSNGTFFIIPSRGAAAYSRRFGGPGDQPVVGDFDGDGKTDIALYRPYDTGGAASWYVIKSSNGAATGLSWGTLGDVPLPADYDGDGKTDPAVWRPGRPSAFYVVQSSNGQAVGIPWGQALDIPVAR